MHAFMHENQCAEPKETCACTVAFYIPGCRHFDLNNLWTQRDNFATNVFLMIIKAVQVKWGGGEGHKTLM